MGRSLLPGWRDRRAETFADGVNAFLDIVADVRAGFRVGRMLDREHGICRCPASTLRSAQAQIENDVNIMVVVGAVLAEIVFPFRTP